MFTGENEKRIRTTISLPASMLSAIDQIIHKSSGDVSSRAEFLERAIQDYLADLERSKIDAAFEGMATDKPYQAQARRIVKEFEGSEEPM